MVMQAEMANNVDGNIYTKVAELLPFPGENIKDLVQECIDALLDHPFYPVEALREIESFKEAIDKISLDDLQGIYSYTFEFSSDYSLDLGYHIYEGFKRSNNLVSLKVMYKSHGFPFDEIAKGELPDNLPVFLKFMDFEKNEVLKKDLREGLLIKGLEALNKNFERHEKGEYAHLIKAILIIVDADVKRLGDDVEEI